jgi:blue copper oxidase
VVVGCDRSSWAGGAASRYLLHVPPFISAQSTLTAAPGRIDLGGGSLSNALMYNQTLPGPTFVVSRGTQVAASLVNHLTEPTTIHWHGLVVPTAADGQPQEAVAPGGSYLYSFTVNQRAALNFYHPHPHMMTGKQVYSGLAGAFVVRDNEEGALGLPGGGYEVPLVVRDASFDSAGADHRRRVLHGAGGVFLRCSRAFTGSAIGGPPHCGRTRSVTTTRFNPSA